MNLFCIDLIRQEWILTLFRLSFFGDPGPVEGGGGGGGGEEALKASPLDKSESNDAIVFKT